jgi:hypothetical protein
MSRMMDMMRTETNMMGLTMNRLRVASESEWAGVAGKDGQDALRCATRTPGALRRRLAHAHIVKMIVATIATAVTIVG